MKKGHFADENGQKKVFAKKLAGAIFQAKIIGTL